MKSPDSLRAAEMRAQPRVKQKSRLIIGGEDLVGDLFTEDTETHDLSASGVSFYLRNRPWIEDLLDITILPEIYRGLRDVTGRKVKGKVVRTGEVSRGKQFVAARFVGGSVNTDANLQRETKAPRQAN